MELREDEPRQKFSRNKKKNVFDNKLKIKSWLKLLRFKLNWLMWSKSATTTHLLQISSTNGELKADSDKTKMVRYQLLRSQSSQRVIQAREDLKRLNKTWIEIRLLHKTIKMKTRGKITSKK